MTPTEQFVTIKDFLAEQDLPEGATAHAASEFAHRGRPVSIKLTEHGGFGVSSEIAPTDYYCIAKEVRQSVEESVAPPQSRWQAFTDIFTRRRDPIVIGENMVRAFLAEAVEKPCESCSNTNCEERKES